jgi:hypothetical protein
MRATVAIGMAFAGLLFLARPASSHHAFSAEYDSQKPIDIKGTVTKVEWTNPHAHSFLPGGELLEYICQENNIDLEHILGPARLP